MKSRISDHVADEAGYWDARLRAPDCSDADRARFAAWRDTNPEHREAFERLQTILTGLRRNTARADVRALRDAALRTEKPVVPRTRFVAAAVVATLASAVALWTTLPVHFKHASLPDTLVVTGSLIGAPRPGIYETGIGERSISNLQDGSSVELNAKTQVKVAFGKSTRNVELVYGQAIFHVAPDAKRPFVVRAADRDITALGTQFDVRLDGTSVRVTLIEGKVKVSSEPAEKVAYLTPGQQLVAPLHNNQVGAGSTPAVRDIDVSKVTGWREGRVFLEDLTLSDAVAEMNRHSPIQIVITDPEIAALRVNGMFRAGEQQAFVTALEQYFPVGAREKGDTEIELTRRAQ